MIHKVVKGLLPQKPPQKLLAGCWFSPKRRKKREKKNVHQIVVTSPMWKNNMVSKFNVHPFVRPKFKCFVWDSPFPRSQIVPIELGYATFKKNMRIMFLLTFNIPLSTTYTSHPFSIFFRYLYKSPWSPMGRKFENLDTSPSVLVHLGSTSAASLATGADAVSDPRDPGCGCRS